MNFANATKKNLATAAPAAAPPTSANNKNKKKRYAPIQYDDYFPFLQVIIGNANGTKFDCGDVKQWERPYDCEGTRTTRIQ